MPKEKVETNKDKLLSDVLTEIEREYGKGSVMKLGDRAAVDIEPIPSGSLLLDDALGIGGYPKGRIIEIFGPESSGKTTLALHAVAEVQKKGGRAAFIDAENAIDPVYAKNLGVNIDELILSQPDSGEQGLDIMLMLVESGAVDLVVVDSVAALVPQAELDGEMGDNQVGLQARMMSKAMRKLAGAMNQNDCTAIFINQLREKVGVIYGNPETTPGGRALKFYSSVRVDIRKADAIKNGTDPASCGEAGLGMRFCIRRSGTVISRQGIGLIERGWSRWKGPFGFALGGKEKREGACRGAPLFSFCKRGRESLR